MKKIIGLTTVVVLLVGAAFVSFRYYSVLFSKTVDGVVSGVERVELEAVVAPMDDRKLQREMFSFAVAIKAKDGEIYTASSEDRRWAVVEKGACVEARFYPYPFWDLERRGMYFSARLIRIHECQ